MTANEDTTRMVCKSYDCIAAEYDEGRASRTTVNEAWLDELSPLMPATGTVLDLGCGGGRPIAKYFADHGYAVTGVDISPAMIELARVNIPDGVFDVADMADLQRPEKSFDIIVCLFALFHLPRAQHGELLSNMHDWLKPGGMLLISLCIDDHESCIREDWHDVPMYWSCHDRVRYQQLLDELGFEIRREDTELFNEQRHWWVLARRGR